MILWQIWLSRCDFVFNKTIVAVDFLERKAISFLSEFRRVLEVNANEPPPIPFPTHWMPPLLHTWKINADGAFRDGLGAAGFIVRDWAGNVLSAHSILLGPTHSSIFAESWAIYYGLSLTSRVWNGEVIIESDSATLVSMILCDDPDISPLGDIISRIRSYGAFFKTCIFKYVSRFCNTPADLLAKLGFNNPHSPNVSFCNWGTQPPDDVISASIADVIF